MKTKSIETLLYSTVGVAVMLVIVIAINFMAGVARTRVDMTEEKMYTLSPGSKKIISNIDGKLKIRFYCTQDAANMPVVLRNYAQRVDDLLAEYRKMSGGKIIVEKLNPQPDTDAEDFAGMDGIEPRQISMTESIYMGISFSFLDEKMALPYLPPEREKFLEYDISRAISRVLHPERPVIGVMSGLPVFGVQMPPQMMMQMGQRGGQEPWMFITELQKDFNVKQVQMDTDVIEDDIKLLIVHHPKNISDKAQFAIDQFVLRGGKLIAFLDPFCAMDQSSQQNPMAGGAQQGGSNMEKLLKTWGLEFEANKVLVDLTLKGRFQPGHLVPTLSPQYLKQDEIITSQLDNIVLGFAGAYSGTPAEGLKMDVLMHSSANSQMADRFMAQMAGEQLVKDFKAGGKELNLAVRLTGKFKTAFPGGKPEESKPEDAEKKDEKKDAEKKDDSLKASTTDGVVILVGDSDMLHERLYADVQNLFGQKIMMVHSGNLTFLQNASELLSGDSNLINCRSRATKSRNFTLIREMQAKAAQQFQAELQKLEAEKNEAQRKLNELQAKKDPNQRFAGLSPEQKAEVDKYRKTQAETNRHLKDVKKALRREEESLENRLKWMNIATMPFVVTLFGIGLAVYNRKRTAAK